MNSGGMVVGIGEILWDLLPSGRQLGGAPANFAYCAHLLGNRGIVASRVGADDLGKETRETLLGRGITDRFLQTDPSIPTGTVNVQLNAAGQPKFKITYPAAWDSLEWSESWQYLARSADAICFGSLAQRSDSARNVIAQFLRASRPQALRIFDINLRQSFYSRQVLADSMLPDAIVKLSDEEMSRVADVLNLPDGDPYLFCQRALERFRLRLICLTRGDEGSILFSREGTNEHPGFHVEVKDAVGAGDAFTAGLVHECLRGSSLGEMNDVANRMGAWVASHTGAMPRAPVHGLRTELDSLVKK